MHAGIGVAWRDSTLYAATALAAIQRDSRANWKNVSP